MTVFFYSIKGGQGKTTHAVAYAKHAWAVLVTNDLDNGTADIFEAALPGDRIVMLEPGQSVASVVAPLHGRPVVIDFGWFIESRVTEAAALADAVVVPVFYQSNADLMAVVKTLNAVMPCCPNVAVLINNTDPVEVADLADVLSARFGCPVFVVNRSRYMARLADDGLSVTDLADLGSLEAFHLRHIVPQMARLHAWIDAARRP
jgi:MinD-like ATPase involved in chromosome partitioning or flagellar assembly